ncbi:hypothetical protein [Photobacterium leiognathi]|uniref:hypothetical protein n=1 Tax=Photobacterium leiognathi TaxID=553611 RepID=UPI002980BB82|nr:hypothetical protein [Photobacterium leiognathi]
MIALKNNIKFNFVFLRDGDIHIGCGFIFPFNESLYCLTAGHVVFGNKFDKERKINIFDIENNQIERIELLSSLQFAKDYDLAIYKINSDVKNIKNVILSESIVNNKLFSFSYIKANSISEPYFIDMCVFNDDLKSNKVRYSTKTNAFNNYEEDEFGGDAMEGISGSPMFLSTWDNSIVLHGIINKIPNQGVASFVETCELYPLKEIVKNIEIVSRFDFDSSHKLIRFSSNLDNKEKFNNWVENWRSLPENKGYYENLENKLKTIYGDSFDIELQNELQKIMVGDECYRNVIERNSVLYDSYQDVVDTAEKDPMKKFVRNESEALEHYQNIYRDHLEVITEDLSSFDLSRTDRKKIAQYNVATWMAVCHLRFSKK